MSRTLIVLASLCFALNFTGRTAHAEGTQSSAEPSADEIARRTLRADSWNWEGARTRLKMILVEADGRRKERAMEVTARRAGKLLQSLVRFSAPPELAGTAFLMLEQPGGASEQYVYLSGLKRTRRIVGREREGSFMGSDFSYADLQPIPVGQAKNARRADEAVGKDACYVIESTLASGGGSPYGKVVSWVRKSDFVALRTRFLDPAGKLVKTLYARRVREMDGRQVVVEARMQSENGHATELVLESIERRADLSDAMFTPSALERM
jgi:hypothetical protein